jgi:hypothetical protein
LGSSIHESFVATVDGLTLEFSDNRTASDSLDAINDELHTIGAGVWPLDLSDTPADISALLGKPVLDGDRSRMRDDTLPAAQATVAADPGPSGMHAGGCRGGALSTFVANLGQAYPQLHLVQEDVDYSRFDKFHVNAGVDGGGIDEVFQMLSGTGFVVHQRLDNGTIVTLRLGCPTSAAAGWELTAEAARISAASIRPRWVPSSWSRPSAPPSGH